MSLKDDKETKTTEQTDEKEESGAQDNAQDNGLPKTQEELDALIEKRLKRERKKMGKEQQTAPPAQTGTQQQENTPPPADTAAAQENLLLKAQLSAIKDGVNPQYVEDAVYLALRDAERKGEADEDGISDALKEVLKRHPEWSASTKKDDEKGGFRVGASHDNQGQKKNGKTSLTGTVIL